jgi:hypothetical protein
MQRRHIQCGDVFARMQQPLEPALQHAGREAGHVAFQHRALLWRQRGVPGGASGQRGEADAEAAVFGAVQEHGQRGVGFQPPTFGRRQQPRHRAVVGEGIDHRRARLGTEHVPIPRRPEQCRQMPRLGRHRIGRRAAHRAAEHRQASAQPAQRHAHLMHRLGAVTQRGVRRPVQDHVGEVADEARECLPRALADGQRRGAQPARPDRLVHHRRHRLGGKARARHRQPGLRGQRQSKRGAGRVVAFQPDPADRRAQRHRAQFGIQDRQRDRHSVGLQRKGAHAAFAGGDRPQLPRLDERSGIGRRAQHRLAKLGRGRPGQPGGGARIGRGQQRLQPPLAALLGQRLTVLGEAMIEAVVPDQVPGLAAHPPRLHGRDQLEP